MEEYVDIMSKVTSDSIINKLIVSDALEFLKKMPDDFVNCVITSPPYFGLRNYGIKGQIGLEDNIEIYIQKLINVFREARRILRNDGTCWVVIGDTYRDKSLLLIPFRFAIAMQEDGWILRNVIIWHKTNAMPHSADDRFTVDFEYILFFTKSKKYWFKQVFEPVKESTINRIIAFNKNKEKFDPNKHKWDILSGSESGMKVLENYSKKFSEKIPLFRNKRAVWSLPTAGLKEEHFAAFPESLVSVMLDAGCPEFVCKRCGTPKRIINEVESIKVDDNKYLIPDGMNCYRIPTKGVSVKQKYISGCSCSEGDNDFIGGIVLDPFVGSGTTCIVALKQNKRFIGIDINEKYIDIAKKRIDRLFPLLLGVDVVAYKYI